MSDNAEAFRSMLVSRLSDSISQDQLRSVLAVLDSALQEYDITRKPVALVPASGMPDVVKYFLASKAIENASPGTLKIYGLRLADFFRRVQKPFSDVQANDIRMYLYYYKSDKHASDSYLDSIRRILSAFFSWLVANDFLLRSPCASIDCIKHQAHERIPLSPYELEELRWACKTIREKALVDFLFSTGIRASECSGVNREDIDWTARSVVIHHGKGDKRRMVYFNAESELSLRKYLETRSDTDEALFVSVRSPHHRLGVRSIESEITRIAQRCGKHVYPHKLRHTFATCGLRGGLPLDKLQALMGHAKPETTLIYAKQDQTDLQREHARVYA